MKNAKKVVVLVLCAALLMAASVMGTLAYLTSKDEIKNTFTSGNVTIELKENKMNPATGELDGTERVDSGIQDIKIVPGREIEKQPVVIVGGTSENCWLFVKVENGDTTKDVLGSGSFAPTADWEAVSGESGWYQLKSVATAGGNYQVFEKFTVGNLENGQVAALAGGSIKVTAYAVQSENVTQATAFATAKTMG